MTKFTFAATATALLMATTALAGPVEDLVAQLEAEGYTQIQVETEGTETEIEAIRNDVEREITLDTETGAVLTDETELASEEGGDDDDDLDEDDAEDETHDDDADEDDDEHDEDETDQA